MRTEPSFNFLQAIIAAIRTDNNCLDKKVLKTGSSISIDGSIVLLLNILFMLLLSINVMAAPAGPSGGSPPLVTVAPVIEQDVNPPAQYVGHVEAIQSVDLRARVEGFLEQVNFKEGSDVHAGDLLYVIEPAPYQARVDNI